MRPLFTLILAFFTISLWAQELPGTIRLNSFQLDAGMIQLKDKNLLEKVHTGLLYGLVFEHAKLKRNSSTFAVGIRYSRLKTKFEELSASANVMISGSYNYLFETKKRERFSCFLGPEVKLIYDLSFYPNWDESHFYWASALNFGVRNKLNYQISHKQSLVLDLGLSLFSVYSRPEVDRQYKIDDTSIGGIVENMHSHLEGGTLDKSVNISLQAEYRFHTSERITQSICYSYDYKRIKSKEGLPFQESLHKIGLKISF